MFRGNPRISEAMIREMFGFKGAGYSYPVDRGQRSGVPAARRAAKKRRNVLARQKK